MPGGETSGFEMSGGYMSRGEMSWAKCRTVRFRGRSVKKIIYQREEISRSEMSGRER
jgi:hypothetical protein